MLSSRTQLFYDGRIHIPILGTLEAMESMNTIRVLNSQALAERTHTWLTESGILKLRSIIPLLVALILVPAIAAEDTAHGPDSARQGGVPVMR